MGKGKERFFSHRGHRKIDTTEDTEILFLQREKEKKRKRGKD